MSRISAQ